MTQETLLYILNSGFNPIESDPDYDFLTEPDYSLTDTVEE
jgi:hypothetical protein